MTEANSKPVNLQRQMVKGSAWTIALRWAARMLGLVSTLVLARLLLPKDFGIVTIAMIVVGTVESLNQTGQYLAIIRHQAPTREHYDSAWTIFIILSSMLAVAVFFAAPIAELYFHEPNAVLVVRVLALKTFIGGFENVGIVNLQRDLTFDKQFLFRVLPSLVSFIVTLGAALVLRNYWALVIGILSQEFSSFALSYILSPYRPRFSFAKVRELWSFSTWIFIRSIGGYLGNQVDKIVVGNFAGAIGMGRYEIAVDVSSSPSQEINNPMVSVLFPVMAKAQGDRTKVKELYLTVLYWSVLICTSTGIGVALVTDDLVNVVLGPKWIDIKPLVPLLALAYGIAGFSATIFPVFDTLGKPRTPARMQWVSMIVNGLVLVPIGLLYRSLYAVVVARFVLACLTVPVMFGILAIEFDLRFRDFLTIFWRPLFASTIMAGFVVAIQYYMLGGMPRLLATVGAGATAYVLTIMVIWWLTGRPDGPEKTVFHILRNVISRSRLRSVLPEELGIW